MYVCAVVMSLFVNGNFVRLCVYIYRDKTVYINGNYLIKIVYINDIFFLVRESDMFYATNNPYQLSGPRGFTEFKLVEETTQMFARIDFPGVIKESVKMSVGSSKKAVFVSGKAPKELEHDVSFREFETAVGLSCECCKIINVEGYLADGVLRLIISKEMINFRVGSSCAGNFLALNPFFFIIYVV